MNTRQIEVYKACLASPPESRMFGIGSAYWHGYENPRIGVEQAGPKVGLSGSDTRAAFKAGQAAAKAAKANSHRNCSEPDPWCRHVASQRG